MFVIYLKAYSSYISSMGNDLFVTRPDIARKFSTPADARMVMESLDPDLGPTLISIDPDTFAFIREIE